MKTLIIIGTLLILHSQAVIAAEEELPAPERQKIEALIGTVEAIL